MKNLLLLAVLFTFSVHTIAQGNSNGKGKDKGKNNNSKSNTSSEHGNKHDDIVWSGVPGNEVHGKSSKNQPKKVQAALMRDYPGASNIIWSKYKGDYTATFNNGPWRSTAVYHANGERRDTRTSLTHQQLPGSIWDQVFKRDNIVPVTYVRIETPSLAERVFRVMTDKQTAYYYTESGKRVQYDY